MIVLWQNDDGEEAYAVMNIETRVSRLEDVERIRGLKAHYCDLCDEGYDADALIDLFTADAVWDGGDLGRFDGRDDVTPRPCGWRAGTTTNWYVSRIAGCFGR